MPMADGEGRSAGVALEQIRMLHCGCIACEVPTAALRMRVFHCPFSVSPGPSGVSSICLDVSLFAAERDMSAPVSCAGIGQSRRQK